MRTVLEAEHLKAREVLAVFLSIVHHGSCNCNLVRVRSAAVRQENVVRAFGGDGHDLFAKNVVEVMRWAVREVSVALEVRVVHQRVAGVNKVIVIVPERK